MSDDQLGPANPDGYRFLIDPSATTPDWRPISTAPKDGSRILVILKSPIPSPHADLRRRWDGMMFVARHLGVAEVPEGFDVGWQFAAPVGFGGFPDEWIAGWRSLPPPPCTEPPK